MMSGATVTSRIGLFLVGVEQPQICNKVGHVVPRQKRLFRSGVGNLWRLRHASKVGRPKGCL
jgi:hypothetical protein